MKVKCIDNSGQSFPKDVYALRKENFNITIGKEYIVYGIETFKRLPWYLICEDHFDGEYINYPMYVFFGCFHIIDGRLSQYWQVKDDADRYIYNERKMTFGFEEFLLEDSFYENLLNNCEREVYIFKRLKRLMDSEFF